jgi:hypothetical protein
MEGRIYIRKKGKKFIIEQKVDGKTKYLKTLPDAQTLLNILNGVAFAKIMPKPSFLIGESKEELPQTFAQSILTEQDKKDGELDTLQKLREAQNKIMKEVLG